MKLREPALVSKDLSLSSALNFLNHWGQTMRQAPSSIVRNAIVADVNHLGVAL